MRIKNNSIVMEDIAATCFFLICFFKSFWYLSAPDIFLRFMMFFGALLAVVISRPSTFLKITKLELIWILTLMIPIISRVFRTYHGNSMSETIGFTTFYISSTLYAFACARNKRLISSSFKIIFFYMLFFVICTILFKFTPSLYLNNILPMFNRDENLRLGYLSGNMAGLTSHYSTNAIYMAGAVLLAVSTVMTNRKKSRSWIIFLVLSGIALFMTGKRGQLIFSIAAIMIGYYFYNVDKPKGRLFKLICLLVLGTCLIYIGYLIVPSAFSSITRILSKMETDDITTGRISLWLQAISYFKEYPVIGIGFKQFIRITGLDVHNIYIQFLCETGIVGAVVYLSALIYTFRVNLKNLITAKLEHLYERSIELNEKYLLFSFLYQIFFLTYGITGNPFYDLPSLMPYMFSVGITLYYQKDIKRQLGTN